MVARSGVFSQLCLQLGDVSMHGELLTVFRHDILNTVADKARNVCIMIVSLMGTYMYPVTLLTEFIRARGALPAPFFACPNGKLMLRRVICYLSGYWHFAAKYQVI